MAVNSFREDEEQKQVMNRETIVRLFRYLLSYKKTIAIVLVIMAVTTGITMINPLLIQHAIDVDIAEGDIRGLLGLGVLALVLNLVWLAGDKLRMMMVAKMANHVLLEIRDELYVHIQKLSFHFFDSRPTGKILARVIGDVNSLKEVLSDSVTTLIPDFCTIIGVMAIMMALNWKLALAALITLPFLAGGMYVIQTFSHKRWQLVRKKNSNVNAFVHEKLSGIRIVQSFRSERESMEDFEILVNDQVRAYTGAVRFADAFGPLIDVTWGVGGFLLYFIGIRLLGVGNVGIGTFLAFSTYLGMFWSPLRNLANFYNKMVTNLSAAERVFEILDTDPEIKDREGVMELPDVKGEVRFDHVSFAYEDAPDQMVLKDVSFTIKPGETIALVGPTGAGKTTIVNLISRFYEVTEGRVLVDGYDLRDVSILSLRKQMGVMTQDNFLFSGTIKENIRYGRLDATDEEIIAAAKAVNAHAFIMQMENGYDTKISERGAGLSIGQRQLLAFARTMVSMPKILILDEATSSIDTHTERLVQQGIETLLQGRTSFVIAHRLSTIKKADRIFVIDHGTIMEEGNHSQLMDKRGAYYDLYQAQFKNL
ncbi:MAG: ABC transporter ATP-binding protein [Lachnospiraceae bacterium]